MKPHFDYEKKHWKKGRIVLGIDEVGRGSFAGPLFAACVGFGSGVVVESGIEVDDSKKITQKRREIAYKWIFESNSFVGVGKASVQEINEKGVGKATFLAMQRAVNNAVKNLGNREIHLLVDGFFIPNYKKFPKENQTRIIKGDATSFTIAAASIVAKVQRDAYMISLSKKYGTYDWHLNKGYGTKSHREAIKKYGTTKEHRIQFVETFLSKQKNKKK